MIFPSGMTQVAPELNDILMIADSSDGNATKKTLFSQVKTLLGLDDEKQAIFQFDLSAITLSASNISTYSGIYQHIGITSDTFLKGAFYVAESYESNNTTLYRFRQISSIPAVKNITCIGEYAVPETQLVDFGLSPQKITAISYQRVIRPLAESEETACVLACTNLTNLPETGELVLIIDNNATKADTVAEGEEQTYTGVPLNVILPTTLTGYRVVNMANLTTIPVAYSKSLEVHFLIINSTVRITLIRQ